MNSSDFSGNLYELMMVLVFFVLLMVFTTLARKRKREKREIPGYNHLKRAIGLAVETGNRLHISIGRGSLVGIEGSAALAGLSILERITRMASSSDRPPIVTSGEGSLSILTQDVLRTTYISARAEAQYNPNASRLTGVTPLAYAAGAMTLVPDEQVSTNILVGHFSSEAALLTESGEQFGKTSFGSSEELTGQAVLYATTQEPIVGEEIFAGGAYLEAGPAHEASLQVQDIFRWLIILIILLGAVARLAGLM